MLTSTETADGQVLCATTDALHLICSDSGVQTTGYLDILDARWEPDTATLHLVTVAGPTWFRLAGASLLPETVRERVQSSIVLSQRVSVRGRGGATVVARRTPRQQRLSWQVRYDGGADPDDPLLRVQVEAALVELRAATGEGPDDGNLPPAGLRP